MEKKYGGGREDPAAEAYGTGVSAWWHEHAHLLEPHAGGLDTGPPPTPTP